MEAEPKKKRAKRVYDEAFRREAVALLESGGEPLSALAARLGVSHWNLRDWRERYGAPARGAKGGQRAGTPPGLSGEVARLRKENASLQARCEV